MIKDPELTSELLNVYWKEDNKIIVKRITKNISSSLCDKLKEKIIKFIR